MNFIPSEHCPEKRTTLYLRRVADILHCEVGEKFTVKTLDVPNCIYVETEYIITERRDVDGDYIELDLAEGRLKKKEWLQTQRHLDLYSQHTNP
jgi:hypothetical protein